MQLRTIATIMPICNYNAHLDRVRTIQCSVQLTAARFRHQLYVKHHSSVAGRCASAFRVCTWQQVVTAGVKLILQNIPNKAVRFNIHTGFPLTDPQKLTFQPCVDLWLSCHKRNTHYLCI